MYNQLALMVSSQSRNFLYFCAFLLVTSILVQLKIVWDHHGTKMKLQSLNATKNKTTNFEPKEVSAIMAHLKNGKPCDNPSPLLIGHLREKEFYKAEMALFDLKLTDLASIYPDIIHGGSWTPKECQPTSKIAIIVAYRDREQHLAYFLFYLIPILKRQLLDFRFIVAEQLSLVDSFNKGRLYNAGFKFAETLDVDCVVFHDVDMLPLDDRNYYGCPPMPRHIAPFTDSLNFELWYHHLVGGVLAISMKHYKWINGYSNWYWGWGGEDDDIGKRILISGLEILRPHIAVARFTMIKHKQRKRENRKTLNKLLGSIYRYTYEGLNSTPTQWNITKMRVDKFYYHILVEVGQHLDPFYQSADTQL